MLGIFLGTLGVLWLLHAMIRWMVRAAVLEEVRAAIPAYLGQNIPEEPPYQRWQEQAEALEEVDGFELEDEDEPWKRA